MVHIPPSPSAFARRTIAWLAVASLVAGGCARPTAVEPSQLPEDLPAVKLYLHDGTFAWLRQAHLTGDGQFVRGIVRTCRGPSCPRIKAERRVALESVEDAQLYPRDITRNSAIGASIVVVGIIAGGVTVGAMSASSSSGSSSSGSFSCPLVYAHDGTDWVLDSGTFGGSMIPGHPRTDFDVLEAATPTEDRLTLRVETPPAETDFTDLMAVHAVDHPKGSVAVPELGGGVALFTTPTVPARATDLRGREVLADIGARDGRYWRSEVRDRDPAVATDARDGLLLEVERPAGADEARIWLSAMNTPWSVRMVSYLLSQLGPEREAFARTLAADAGARAAFEGFMIREGMIRVFVETPEGWSPRGFFWEAGPEVRKDQALRVPIADLPAGPLRVRLETTVGYWQIDAVQFDFGEEPEVERRRLELVEARSSAGEDVRAALNALDGSEVRTRRGDRIDLSYRVPPAPEQGHERTWLLESAGYYLVDVTPDPEGGIARLGPLMANEGAASQRSLAMLQRWLFEELLK